MKREYHKWFSGALGRDMELLVFGHAGPPVLVFPTSLNRFWEWEEKGMIEALKPKIESGHNRLICIDSLDRENIYNRGLHPADRFKAYDRYVRYVLDEAVPFVYALSGGTYVMIAGASFGAYHAVNVALRQPLLFHRVIAMGGNYGIGSFTGGYYDHDIYSNNPVDFMRSMQDQYRLEQVRKLDIRLVTGEHDMCLEPTKNFSEVLQGAGVAHTFDVWGNGTGHDWPWWHHMIQKHIL
jgi:esterase/lipase superfamily enzyme